VHQFEPVVWENGMIRQLPTYTGDSYGVAAQINDKGQIVGRVGELRTFNPNTGLHLVEITPCCGKKTARSMISATSAGLEGSRGTTLVALNNQGQVVGHSELPTTQPFTAFYGPGKRVCGTSAVSRGRCQPRSRH